MDTLRSKWIALPFLAAVLLLNLSSLSHKSATTDEPYHLDFGRRILTSPSVSADLQRMPITALNALPVLVLERLGFDASPRTRLFIARVPTVLLSLGLGWLVFTWSRELWGWQGGLLSITLYTFSPNILAHSRWATGDLATTLFFFGAVRAFVAYLKAPSYRRLVWCAVWTGTAQIAKHTSLLLFPLFAAIWAIDAYRRSRQSGGGIAGLLRGRLKAGTVAVVLFSLVVLLVINAGYGFKGSLLPVERYLSSFRQEGEDVTGDPRLERMATLVEPLSPLPVPLPFAYVEALLLGVHYTATGKGHGPNYLLGETSVLGWWYYYLVTLLLKVPLGLYFLIGLSLPAIGAGLRRSEVEDVSFVLVAVSIVVFFSATSSAQIGIRYLLPIFPFLFVSAGRVLADFNRRSLGYRTAVLVSTVWFVVSCLSFHPHYLAYFNELIGDRKTMYRYLADSNVDWNQNAYYLDDYLERHHERPIVVNPAGEVTGTVVVSINELVGVSTDRERYAWLRDSHAPVDHIGYSWLVFEIPPTPQPPPPP